MREEEKKKGKEKKIRMCVYPQSILLVISIMWNVIIQCRAITAPRAPVHGSSPAAQSGVLYI